MFKPITIKDIAFALDLSPSSVSRALRDSHEISIETKERVLKYAQAQNYKRNPMALSLKQRKSFSLGVMVCEVANDFFSQTINGIESFAYKRGYNVIISQSHDSYEREVLNVQHLANRSVDGLLISMSAETKDFAHLQDLHEQGLPIVFFDRVINEIDTHKVTSDNKEASRKATESLINKGFRKIAHLANAPHLSITKERFEGYKKALEDNGLEVKESMIRYCHSGGSRQQEVQEAIEYFLTMEEEPDSIFVASDRLSMGSLKALNVLRPKSEHPYVAGFSNSDVFELLAPSFSCIRQPAFEMGRVAAELLIKLIERKQDSTEFDFITLDTHFNEPSI